MTLISCVDFSFFSIINLKICKIRNFCNLFFLPYPPLAYTLIVIFKSWENVSYCQINTEKFKSHLFTSSESYAVRNSALGTPICLFPKETLHGARLMVYLSLAAVDIHVSVLHTSVQILLWHRYCISRNTHTHLSTLRCLPFASALRQCLPPVCCTRASSTRLPGSNQPFTPFLQLT